jgi:hypothetical protein
MATQIVSNTVINTLAWRIDQLEKENSRLWTSNLYSEDQSKESADFQKLLTKINEWAVQLTNPPRKDIHLLMATAGVAGTREEAVSRDFVSTYALYIVNEIKAFDERNKDNG